MSEETGLRIKSIKRSRKICRQKTQQVQYVKICVLSPVDVPCSLVSNKIRSPRVGFN